MGFLTRDRVKTIFFRGDNEPLKTTATIRRDKYNWLWYRDNGQIVTINPDAVVCIIEELTDSEKPI